VLWVRWPGPRAAARNDSLTSVTSITYTSAFPMHAEASVNYQGTEMEFDLEGQSSPDWPGQQ
jgi:hypothetical protein